MRLPRFLWKVPASVGPSQGFPNLSVVFVFGSGGFNVGGSDFVLDFPAPDD